MGASSTVGKTVAEVACIAAILGIASYFRVFHATFSFLSLDSARDFWIAWHISRGEFLPLAGPLQRGLFHLGPFFYYLTSLAFLVTHSVKAPYLMVGIGDTFSVLLCFYMARRYFGTRAALVSAGLYAVCIQAVFVGRYPGNPGYVHLFVTAYALFFLRFLEKGKWRFLIPSAILLGLSLQLHTSVFFMVPLSAIIALVKFRRDAIKYLAVAGLIVSVFFTPLLVHYLGSHSSGAGEIHGGGLLPAVITGLKSYPERLAGALLLPTLTASMLVPRSSHIYFQPLLLLQCLLWPVFIFLASRAVIGGKLNSRQATALLFIVCWVLVPLLLFPVYPGINHNYLDVIYPGSMVLAGVTLVLLKRRRRTWLLVALIAVAAANLSLLVKMDRKIAETGFIGLYRAPLVNLESVFGHDEAVLTSVPARYQIEVTKGLLRTFSTPQNVMSGFHGPGRLFFLDENKRFLLNFLAERQGLSGHVKGPERHYMLVEKGDNQDRGIIVDIRLSGPFALTRVEPCRLFVNGIERHVPTAAVVDPWKYELYMPRAVKLLVNSPLHVEVRSHDIGVLKMMLSYVYATGPKATVVLPSGDVIPPAMSVDNLFFTRADLYRLSNKDAGTDKQFSFLIKTDQPLWLDLDAYVEK